MSTVKIAQIGLGAWGKNLARNYNNIGALACICDTYGPTLDTYRDQYPELQAVDNYQAVADDKNITAVSVASPAPSHYDVVKLFLEAGKDVYVEKPLCLTVDEAEELVQYAEKHSRVLMVGHLLQYHPVFACLRGMVESGELGDIRYIRATRMGLGAVRRQESVLWDLAPHDISMILSLLGNEEPTQVGAHGGGWLADGIDDIAITAMEFASGARAHIFNTWMNPVKEQRVTVYGTKATAIFDDPQPWAEKLTLYRETLPIAEDGLAYPDYSVKGEHILVEEGEPLLSECQHFVDCCTNRDTPRTDGQEGLRVLRVLAAAEKSING